MKSATTSVPALDLGTMILFLQQRSSQAMKAMAPIAKQPRCVCDDTLDFIQAPGFPSAMRVFALTHSRRMLFNASRGLSL